jgi:hypothetical protein
MGLFSGVRTGRVRFQCRSSQHLRAAGSLWPSCGPLSLAHGEPCIAMQPPAPSSPRSTMPFACTRRRHSCWKCPWTLRCAVTPRSMDSERATPSPVSPCQLRPPVRSIALSFHLYIWVLLSAMTWRGQVTMLEGPRTHTGGEQRHTDSAHTQPLLLRRTLQHCHLPSSATRYQVHCLPL